MTTSGMDAQMMDCLLQFFCYRVLDQLNRAQASSSCKSLPDGGGLEDARATRAVYLSTS